MWKLIIALVLVIVIEPFIKSTIVQLIIWAAAIYLCLRGASEAYQKIYKKLKKDFIQDLKKELAETEKKDDQRD